MRLLGSPRNIHPKIGHGLLRTRLAGAACPKRKEGSGVTPTLLVEIVLEILPESRNGLQRLNVRSLPSLGALDNVELYSLAFLQTLEATRVDRRVVHEDVLAVLTRDEAEALRVIEPFHGTLFHFARNS